MSHEIFNFTKLMVGWLVVIIIFVRVRRTNVEVEEVKKQMRDGGGGRKRTVAG